MTDDKKFLDRRPRGCYKVLRGFFAPHNWQKKILERCHWLICFYYTHSNKKYEGLLRVMKRIGEALDKADCVPEF